MADAGAVLPAATVVVVRDGALGLEVLLLERVSKPGNPGTSVFPGGRVEASDRSGGALDDAAFRRAAVRETREEAGLELRAEALLPISRWITPELAPRRFDTWFYFAALRADAAVRVDGDEIARFRWLEPASALDAHHRREIRLAPPTFVTVSWLRGLGSTAAARAQLAPAAPLTFRPRICRMGDGACMLYPGDAGYEAGDPDVAGPRHRLWALAGGWRYERDES
jgi:8-oxo-dGTP pyrophosphatase MutT (NUDIX family)